MGCTVSAKSGFEEPHTTARGASLSDMFVVPGGITRIVQAFKTRGEEALTLSSDDCISYFGVATHESRTQKREARNNNRSRSVPPNFRYHAYTRDSALNAVPKFVDAAVSSAREQAESSDTFDRNKRAANSWQPDVDSRLHQTPTPNSPSLLRSLAPFWLTMTTAVLGLALSAVAIDQVLTRNHRDVAIAAQEQKIAQERAQGRIAATETLGNGGLLPNGGDLLHSELDSAGGAYSALPHSAALAA